MMLALWSSFAVVALAEMGDKTQLLALALAARYRRPWTVMLGILIATVANHALASSAGVWVAARLSPAWLAWLLALGFAGFGLWALMPDHSADEAAPRGRSPVLTIALVFFLAEMGDKTQLATVALGARFESMAAVTAGTTLGMLVADGLAVFAGQRLTAVVPTRVVRALAAGLFFAFAIVAAMGAGRLH
jgi:Ca2+/H+ antiporter, TMEM165/GDT1 family